MPGLSADDPRKAPGAVPPVAVRTIRLGKRYGYVAAVGGIDLEVAPGSIVALLGANGAGKTTLLRMLATLTRPTSGSAAVDGLDVVHDCDAVRRRIGYVGHRPLLLPYLTVEENLEYSGRLHGLTMSPATLEQALVEVGLDSRRRTPARSLSRGLAQRLSLAASLLHRPAVVLLDEPHTGLDARSADDLDARLSRLADDGRTVLFSSHDLSRALGLADRLVVLHAGGIAWDVLAADTDISGLSAAYARLAASLPGSAAPVEWSGAAPEMATIAPGRSDGQDAGPVAAPAGPAAEASVDPPATPARGPQVEPTTTDLNPPAPSFWGAAAAIVWKDLVVELRAREVVPPVLVFALLMVVVFQFAMPASGVARQSLAPGALWVALLFGSTLGLSRLMAGESDTGGFEALRVSPIDRGAMFTGKWLAGFGFSLTVAALLFPAFVALLALRISPSQFLAVAGVLALGLIGWVAAGVLLGAMAVTTRAREVLLPVLLYPLVLPLVVPAVQATGRVLAGSRDGLAEALVLVGAYDVIFLALGFLLFGRALED